MFTLSDRPYTSLPGFKRTYSDGRLTLGLFFPIEAYSGDTPSMLNQVEIAQKAEAAGFASLWVRDVPLRDPTFGDVGQIYDPWAFLGYLAGQTRTIALGTAGIVIPLRHPLHVAKAAASIDRLTGGRYLLGVATGDRPVEYSAFNAHIENRGEIFRENLGVVTQALSTTFRALHWSRGAMVNADLVPKPLASQIPLMVTGSSRQTMGWIAENAHGWITYPRPLQAQREVIKAWRMALSLVAPGLFKPVSQSLFIDLDYSPDQQPVPIHQGYRLGRNALVKLLQELEEIGINHVMIQLKYGCRPAPEVLEELIEYVLPHFPTID